MSSRSRFSNFQSSSMWNASDLSCSRSHKINDVSLQHSREIWSQFQYCVCWFEDKVKSILAASVDPRLRCSDVVKSGQMFWSPVLLPPVLLVLLVLLHPDSDQHHRNHPHLLGSLLLSSAWIQITQQVNECFRACLWFYCLLIRLFCGWFCVVSQ